MWQVLIGGVDRTNLVESVDLNSGLGEGSSAQIYCMVGMPEIPAFSSIIVNMDSVRVFKGYVGAPEEVWDGRPATLQGSRYACYDEGTGFSNVLITGTFSGPANEVLEQVLSYANTNFVWFGDYTLNIQSGINLNVNLTFDYTTLNDCFDQIADTASCYWFVTPDDEICFFTSTTADIGGSTITLNYSDVQTPYNHRKATDKVVNEVTVIGGTATATKTAEWVYDGTQTIFAIPEPIESATVTFDGAPAYLVPEGFSGDPYKPSDKDYANTTSVDTPNDRAGGITHVIIHHIAAVSATKTDIYHWHTDPKPTGNGWSDIGYHWYIRKTGEVIACRPESKIGAHAKGHNAYTIGIACEGDYERADTAMPKAQFNALVAKTIDVMTRYKMNRNNVLFHNDLNSTDCPGKYFPKKDIVNAVKNGNASNYEETPVAIPITDSSNQMYINYAEQYLKVIPTMEPAIGTVIKLTYTMTYNVMDTQRSSQPLSVYGGRVIPRVIADSSITTKEDARRQALALLAMYSKIEETLDLSLINYQNIIGGDKIYLAWLSKYGVVTSVSSRLYLKTSADNDIRIEVKLL